jgi:hypothetical protein
VCGSRRRTRFSWARRWRSCGRPLPLGETSLFYAFAAAKAMNPPPDNILLLTDGLPTQGEKPPRRKTISGKDRFRLLERSLDALPRGVPVNVVLYPREGDPMASPAFWKVRWRRGAR